MVDIHGEEMPGDVGNMGAGDCIDEIEEIRQLTQLLDVEDANDLSSDEESDRDDDSKEETLYPEKFVVVGSWQEQRYQQALAIIIYRGSNNLKLEFKVEHELDNIRDSNGLNVLLFLSLNVCFPIVLPFKCPECSFPECSFPTQASVVMRAPLVAEVITMQDDIII